MSNVQEFTLPPQVQVSIMSLASSAVGRLLGVRCDSDKLYQKAINKKFNCSSSRDVFVDQVASEVLRQKVSRIWWNLSREQENKLVEPVKLAVPKLVDVTFAELCNNIHLTNEDFKTIEDIIMASIMDAPPAAATAEKKIEEPGLFTYSKEDYNDLETKVSEVGYIRLFRTLCEKEPHATTNPKTSVLAVKYFHFHSKFVRMVAAVRLEVMRTELGKAWNASGNQALIPHYVGQNGIAGWWDADSVNEKRIKKYWTRMVEPAPAVPPKYYVSNEMLRKFCSFTSERQTTILKSMGILTIGQYHLGNILVDYGFSSPDDIKKLVLCIEEQALRSEISVVWHRSYYQDCPAYLQKVQAAFPSLPSKEFWESSCLDDVSKLRTVLEILKGPVPVTQPVLTKNQRIVRLLKFFEVPSYRGDAVAAMLTGLLSWTHDQVAFTLSNYLESGLEYWEKLIFSKESKEALLLDEFERRNRTNPKHLATLQGLMGSKIAYQSDTDNLWRAFGVALKSLSTLNQDLVLEYLQTLPLNSK